MAVGVSLPAQDAGIKIQMEQLDVFGGIQTRIECERKRTHVVCESEAQVYIEQVYEWIYEISSLQEKQRGWRHVSHAFGAQASTKYDYRSVWRSSFYQKLTRNTFMSRARPHPTHTKLPYRKRH
jgi:hypothetical protein